MIYILIAGTYTPILLTYLEPPKGAAFTAVMWIIAAAGIVMKLCWFHAPRWLTTSLYLLINLFPYEYRRFVAARIGRRLLYHRRRDLWPEKTQSFCQDRLS